VASLMKSRLAISTLDRRAGHFPWLDHPNHYHRLIAAFLDETKPDGRSLAISEQPPP